jgi:glycosyltransferase involved in cell wall biosynthesis
MLAVLVLLLLFISPLPAEEKQKICLNMIVKNESAVITRCLNSAKPMIDYWVIFDTGSTDGTQEIIKNCMKDIPGELHESPWVNFAHNRNEALDAARDKGDYVLILDADDYLEFEKPFQKGKLTKDGYQLRIFRDSVSYYRMQVISMKCPWRWEGVLHEYLTCDTYTTSDTLDYILYRTTHEGARSQDPEKYRKDAELLEAAVEREPNNGRYVFYLAQSFRDAGIPEKSLEWYKKRVTMGGWDQEVYWSMLQVAHLERDLGYPQEEVVDSYYRAFRYRPHRFEAPYYLTGLYRQMGRNDLAYCTGKAQEFISQPSQKDILFLQDWIEEYGLLFEVSIAAYYVGAYQETIDACDKLLTFERVPLEWKEQIKRNKEFAVAKLNEPAKACA